VLEMIVNYVGNECELYW